MPDVVRRDAKRLSDVVRLKNGIKSRGFDTNQTNMDASDVIAPVGPPRTRSAMAAIHQQAMKGLRAPSTPLEVKLNDELSASAIKTKPAQRYAAQRYPLKFAARYVKMSRRPWRAAGLRWMSSRLVAQALRRRHRHFKVDSGSAAADFAKSAPRLRLLSADQAPIHLRIGPWAFST